MTHPDIDGRRPGRSFDEHAFHDWSLRPVVDDPTVARPHAQSDPPSRPRGARRSGDERAGARSAQSGESRRARERPRRRLRLDAGRRRLFPWSPFAGRPRPRHRRLRRLDGRNDHRAGFDHQTWYHENGRPVAIVSQPYRPAFEDAKREGLVAEVERVRGIRVVELDPVLGWYRLDPVNLPTSLVVWMRRRRDLRQSAG